MSTRSYKTLLEMLDDRNFNISKYNYDKPDFDILVNHKYNKKLLKVYTFPDEKKIGIQHIKDTIEDIENNNIDISIIIFQMTITTFARQFLSSLKKNYKIQIFKESELYMNKTKHYLVPKHTLCTNEEKINILQSLKINECNLPKIKMTDPIARYYGCVPGDLVSIHRSNPDNGFYTFYRLCI